MDFSLEITPETKPIGSENFLTFPPSRARQKQPLTIRKIAVFTALNSQTRGPPTSTKNLDFGGFLAPETHPITPPLNLENFPDFPHDFSPKEVAKEGWRS